MDSAIPILLEKKREQNSAAKSYTPMGTRLPKQKSAKISHAAVD